MATQTPNLGLTLPVGTENVSRTVMNGNNTLIDTFAGGVNTAMDQMGANLGILETGDTATHAIAKGEYVTWKGASYTADAAISIGETLAATGGSKNLTACDKGIANALNSKISDMPFVKAFDPVDDVPCTFQAPDWVNTIYMFGLYTYQYPNGNEYAKISRGGNVIHIAGGTTLTGTYCTITFTNDGVFTLTFTGTGGLYANYVQLIGSNDLV